MITITSSRTNAVQYWAKHLDSAWEENINLPDKKERRVQQLIKFQVIHQDFSLQRQWNMDTFPRSMTRVTFISYSFCPTNSPNPKILRLQWCQLKTSSQVSHLRSWNQTNVHQTTKKQSIDDKFHTPGMRRRTEACLTLFPISASRRTEKKHHLSFCCRINGDW